MATIIDVAKLAGVSKTTVSKILSGKDGVRESSRLRVEDAMKKLGYTPNFFAQGMRTNKTKMIAIIAPDYSNLGYIEMFKGIEEKALEKGYMTMISNTGEQAEMELEYIKELVKRRVDGIIFFTYKGVRKNIDYLIKASKEIPVVFMDHIIEDEPVSYVMTNGFAGSRKAAEYLIRKGRCRIGYIKGPKSVRATHERFKGYLKALEDFNIKYNPELVYEGDFHMKSGFDGAGYFMNLQSPPDAVMAATDIMAIGALKFLKHVGIDVPQGVNVIGFDDMPLCTLVEPPLTTVCQFQRKIGNTAAEVLIEKINNPLAENKRILMNGELVIRRSTDETKPLIQLF